MGEPVQIALPQALRRVYPCRVRPHRVCPRRHSLSRCTALKAAKLLGCKIHPSLTTIRGLAPHFIILIIIKLNNNIIEIKLLLNFPPSGVSRMVFGI